MERKEFEFLKTQINERIANFRKYESRYRKNALRTHFFVSILAAISSIILGLNIPHFEEALRITALIISGIITVVSAYNAFFAHKQMWVAYDSALNDLKKLSFEIEFTERGNEISKDMVHKFKQDYQAILDRLNKTWTELMLK